MEINNNDGFPGLYYCIPPPKTNMSAGKQWLEDDPFLLKWKLFRRNMLFLSRSVYIRRPHVSYPVFFSSWWFQPL